VPIPCQKSEEILSRFPKARPRLPEAYKKIHKEYYILNRNGMTVATSLSQKMEAWLHFQVAQDVSNSKKWVATLELGAGTLNQLDYEPSRGPYDVVEPFQELYKNSDKKTRVRKFYKSLFEIKKGKYDRITSVAVLEHLTNLPQIIEKSIKLLKPNGSFRAAIPNEGTIFWWIGTQFTGFEFAKKYGLSYKKLLQYEHLNTAHEIDVVLNNYFEEVACSYLGFSKKLAFYRFYSCKKPRDFL